MKPFKAPGPDGFHARFFQRFWPLVSRSVTEAVHDVFHSGKVPETLNKTLIILIPKRSRTNCLSSYIPINLCNTFYKAISKVIVGRLRPYLADFSVPHANCICSRMKGY